jgi:3-dehydrosphinganine reductase
VLVNCAGTSVAGAFEELEGRAFEDLMRINFLGSVYPTRALLPAMKERRQGAVVFVSSQAGQVRA